MAIPEPLRPALARVGRSLQSLANRQLTDSHAQGDAQSVIQIKYGQGSDALLDFFGTMKTFVSTLVRFHSPYLSSSPLIGLNFYQTLSRPSRAL